MQISFDLTEKEEEIDGEDVVTFFNKRERFINYIPFTNIILWDQVQNYGYQRLPDGTLEARVMPRPRLDRPPGAIASPRECARVRSVGLTRASRAAAAGHSPRRVLLRPVARAPSGHAAR